MNSANSFCIYAPGDELRGAWEFAGKTLEELGRRWDWVEQKHGLLGHLNNWESARNRICKADAVIVLIGGSLTRAWLDDAGMLSASALTLSIFENLRNQGKPVLFLFVEPSCFADGTAGASVETALPAVRRSVDDQGHICRTVFRLRDVGWHLRDFVREVDTMRAMSGGATGLTSQFPRRGGIPAPGNLRGSDAECSSADSALRLLDLRRIEDEARESKGGSQDSGRPSMQPSSPAPPAAPTTSMQRENRALDDNVQFTVFQPEVITPHQWCDFLAYAHLSAKRPDAPEHEPDPKKEVERRARAALGAAYDEYDRLRQNSSVAFPKDGEVTFAPEVEGAEFNPRSITFLWAESVHEARFRVRAKAGAADGARLRGRMNVYLGPLLVGSVELAMDAGLLPKGADASPRMRPTVAATADTYRTIFASYSHLDTEIVQACQVYAASLGDRLIRDQDFLRSGQDWRPEISRAIERADVFQLFWSPHSAASPEVRWEVNRALGIPKKNFVRPTYWHTPMPPPWSDAPDISGLHFERMPFGGDADAARSAKAPTKSLNRPLEAERSSRPRPRATAAPPSSYSASPPSSGHARSPAGRRSSRWIGLVAAVALVGGVSLLMMSGRDGGVQRPPDDYPKSRPVMDIFRQEAEAKTVEGQQAEAEGLWRALLTLQERDLEPGHEDALRTCVDLALCLEAQGRGADALPFATRAADGFRNLFGEDHPDTLRARDAAERLRPR